MVTIEKILESAQEKSATDVHLMAGMPPRARIDDALYNLDYPKLLSENIEKMVEEILTDEQLHIFNKKGSVMFAFSVGEKGRYRANIYRASGCIQCSIRILQSVIPDVEERNIGTIYRKLHIKPGITIVSGESGSGKTTTLASIVNAWNQNMPIHIMTIEDPIEYLYPYGKALIHQKEIGIDAKSVGDAVREAIYENVDILVVGKCTSCETVEAMIAAAHAGICVLVVMDALDADMARDDMYALLESRGYEMLAERKKKQLTDCLQGFLMISKDEVTYSI